MRVIGGYVRGGDRACAVVSVTNITQSTNLNFIGSYKG